MGSWHGDCRGCQLLCRDLEALRQKWHGFHESPPPLSAAPPGAMAAGADARAQQQQQQQTYGGLASHMTISPSAGHATQPAQTDLHRLSMSAGTRGGTAASWEVQASALAAPMSAASRGGSMWTAAGLQGPPMSAETRGAASTLSPLLEGGLVLGTPVDLLMPAALPAAAFLPAFAQEAHSRQGFLHPDISSPGQQPLSKHPGSVPFCVQAPYQLAYGPGDALIKTLAPLIMGLKMRSICWQVYTGLSPCNASDAMVSCEICGAVRP